MPIKKQYKNKICEDYRSRITKIKADKAIEKLLKNKSKINFASVAKAAGVSRAYLYNNKELRGKIESYRSIQYAGAQVRNKVSEKSKDIIIANLNTKIESLENKLNKREEKIKRIEKEINRYKLMLFED